MPSFMWTINQWWSNLNRITILYKNYQTKSLRFDETFFLLKFYITSLSSVPLYGVPFKWLHCIPTLQYRSRVVTLGYQQSMPFHPNGEQMP